METEKEQSNAKHGNTFLLLKDSESYDTNKDGAGLDGFAYMPFTAKDMVIGLKIYY